MKGRCGARPLQHVLSLLLTTVASVLRFTVSESFDPTTWSPVPHTLAQRNLPYKLVGNGRSGPDPPPPFTGYDHLWRPSDLGIFLLWTSAEYVVATTAFLESTVTRFDGGGLVTVVDALVDSFWFLRTGDTTIPLTRSLLLSFFLPGNGSSLGNSHSTRQ